MYMHKTLGEIAALGPAARGVLLRSQLDFCCGGRQTLAAACDAAGLDTTAIVRELSRTAVPTTHENWGAAPLADVVAYIVNHFHVPLRPQLDAVVAAAEKVERVHAAKETCPRGLAAHLRHIRAELLSHMAKEEEVLFPAIAAGQHGALLDGPVNVLTHEHDGHGEDLRRMRVLATDFEAPANACNTWRTLYEQLAQLEADLMDHIHLENHTLFPRALGA